MLRKAVVIAMVVAGSVLNVWADEELKYKVKYVPKLLKGREICQAFGHEWDPTTNVCWICEAVKLPEEEIRKARLSEEDEQLAHALHKSSNLARFLDKMHYVFTYQDSCDFMQWARWKYEIEKPVIDKDGNEILFPGFVAILISTRVANSNTWLKYYKAFLEEDKE